MSKKIEDFIENNETVVRLSTCCNSILREGDFYGNCKICNDTICYNCKDEHMEIFHGDLSLYLLKLKNDRIEDHRKYYLRLSVICFVIIEVLLILCYIIQLTGIL